MLLAYLTTRCRRVAFLDKRRTSLSCAAGTGILGRISHMRNAFVTKIGVGVIPLLFTLAGGFITRTMAETLDIGIGTQNTTTNTVTAGIVLKELGLLEK